MTRLRTGSCLGIAEIGRRPAGCELVPGEPERSRRKRRIRLDGRRECRDLFRGVRAGVSDCLRVLSAEFAQDAGYEEDVAEDVGLFDSKEETGRVGEQLAVLAWVE